MGGGLMQLVAYGAQDIYLTGNPQITFFKVVYRRHTNFSMESIEQTLSGSPDFGKRVTATISRNGDLVSRLWYEMSPKGVLGTRQHHSAFPMQCLLKSTEIEIGGQRIDKHYNHWLNVWTELTEQLNPGVRSLNGFLNSVDVLGTVDVGQQIIKAPTAYQLMTFGATHDPLTDALAADTVDEGYAIIPLQFWFCRNPGLALPLIALQYHEVKVITEFGSEDGDVGGAGGSPDGNLNSVKLWADYIYLDTDERRRFAQVSHEYLIEQVQHQSEGPGKSFTLNFNHPVKELIWTGIRKDRPGNTSDLAKKSDTTVKLHSQNIATDHITMTLKLNNHDRFAPRHQAYFTRCQPWTYHHHPHGGFKQDAISVYSFALKPEEHQPSGTCNFSRIDTAKLVFSDEVCGSANDVGLNIYAVNYNVLRIMSGMGGLAYSN